MELMGSGDLSFTLHRNENAELTDDDRLRVLLQVIKAIEYIHSQGITHRDIKPHNVLLSSDYQVAKLANFGLAGFKNTMLSTRQSQATSGGMAAIGLTPTYAAPELFEGQLTFHDSGWKKSSMNEDVNVNDVLTQQALRDRPQTFSNHAAGFVVAG